MLRPGRLTRAAYGSEVMQRQVDKCVLGAQQHFNYQSDSRDVRAAGVGSGSEGHAWLGRQGKRTVRYTLWRRACSSSSSRSSTSSLPASLTATGAAPLAKGSLASAPSGCSRLQPATVAHCQRSGLTDPSERQCAAIFFIK